MLPDDAPPEALDQAAELLWQAWRFQELGARLYVLSGPALERLLAPEVDARGWRVAAPPASYVQLPYQRLWARVTDQAPWEPVDGWFAAVRARGEGAHEVRALLVLGLRPERPGVSLVPHAFTVRDDEAAARLARPRRERGMPYENAIPGGERMGYHSLASTSEVEALVLRALHALDTRPASLLREEGAAGAERGNATRFPHVLVP